MKRILIIGCPGAGKSTFARKLAAKTGLPLHYLDMIWHRPDRTTLDRDEFAERVTELISGDRWIIDGNYLRTLPLRLTRCDTVILFDLPVEVCLAGALERLGKERADMPWTDDEMDPEFQQWIIDFPSEQLPTVKLLLEEFKNRVHIIRFHTRREADDFIGSL